MNEDKRSVPSSCKSVNNGCIFKSYFIKNNILSGIDSYASKKGISKKDAVNTLLQCGLDNISDGDLE